MTFGVGLLVFIKDKQIENIQISIWKEAKGDQKKLTLRAAK